MRSTGNPPYSRWEGFYVYRNNDETFHILCIDDGGGTVVADSVHDKAIALWLAGLANAAIGASVNADMTGI